MESLEQLNDKRIEQEVKEAWNRAILQGRLSKNPKDKNYAGHYMFMGNNGAKDCFKNILNDDEFVIT